jgi:hypothetical protein
MLRNSLPRRTAHCTYSNGIAPCLLPRVYIIIILKRRELRNHLRAYRRPVLQVSCVTVPGSDLSMTMAVIYDDASESCTRKDMMQNDFPSIEHLRMEILCGLQVKSFKKIRRPGSSNVAICNCHFNSRSCCFKSCMTLQF